LEEKALANFEAYLAKKKTSSHGCTLENAAKRREWYVYQFCFLSG
jgi:tyrosinase